MILVTGGAYQGKTAFAETLLEQQKQAGRDGSLFSQFHVWVKDCMKAERNIEEELREKLEQDPDQIIVCNELGCGVVPMDAFDRKYREAVGRVCTRLAAYSHKVTRVACGIGMVIKND